VAVVLLYLLCHFWVEHRAQRPGMLLQLLPLLLLLLLLQAAYEAVLFECTALRVRCSTCLQ
jgi:hypothetical protein